MPRTSGCMGDTRHQGCLPAPPVCYTGGKGAPRGGRMELTELPAELASFVEQALARGIYPSTEALVADAVRVLRDQDAQHTPRPHMPDTPAHTDVAPSTPED